MYAYVCVCVCGAVAMAWKSKGNPLESFPSMWAIRLGSKCLYAVNCLIARSQVFFCHVLLLLREREVGKL